MAKKQPKAKTVTISTQGDRFTIVPSEAMTTYELLGILEVARIRLATEIGRGPIAADEAQP